MDTEKEENELTVEVDASWAHAAYRRSTSGGLMKLQGFLLGWWSKTQAVIAQSTCEAELIALNAGACEGKFVQQLLRKLGVETRVS
eukprot:4583535-Heterocapsa_arctica.AAC.1